MWQEYTRETPARPFLAPLCTGLALAATLALAWWVRPASAGPSASGMQSPPHWPISFALPEGITWAQQEETDQSADGMAGSVAYDGRSSDLAPSVLGFSYAVLPEVADAQEAAAHLLEQEMTNARPIKMGPMKGIAAEARRGAGIRVLSAVAVSKRGLAVAVQFASPRISARERAAFQAACESIQYRKWWIGKPDDSLIPPTQKH